MQAAQPTRSPDPKVALEISLTSPEDGADEVAAQTVHARVAGELARCQMRQPVPGADPQRAVAVGVERADEVVRQAVGGGESLDAAHCSIGSSPVEQVESVGRADPQVAIGPAGEREDDVAGEAVRGGDVGEAGAGAAVQPRPVGADPQLALGALKDTAHQVAGEPVAGGVGGELLIPQQVEAAGVGAHPQIAFPVLVERQDAVDS